MALSFVDAAHAASTTVTLPTHQAGDLIVIIARNNGLTIPTVPSPFTSITTQTANAISGDQAMSCGYLVATSSSETSGTWTNASNLIALVYRSDSASPAIGDAVATGATGTTMPIPGLTMHVTDGSSWVVFCDMSGVADTDLDEIGTMTLRKEDNAGIACTIAAFDTNGGVSSWSTSSDSGYNNNWGKIGVSIEIKEVIASTYLPDPRLQMKQVLAQ